MSLERERSPTRAYVSRKIREGRISFENVSFAYPNAPGKALDKVSFKIEGGERIGIIGRVGSGKTTVGRLLLGFYEAQEGRILIDGVDSRQYDPSDLRTGIGFAMQDTDLFFGKLRDNIALGKPEATDEEVLAAARLSGVESFIAGHPMGYDMPISEGGRSLSGGQKQAIGLARVLIRKPRVLFLDEPTAHFDVRSEAEFLDRLKAIRGDRMTIIISTHRLSLLSMVDRLLLFDNGRLVPSRQTQVVQSLEGGIVGDILVQEGSIVQQGQSLMRIEDTKFASEFGEIRERRAAMAARVARLEAEARGRSEVTFPDQLDKVVPAAVATETSVFNMRSQKVAQDIDVLNQQVARLNGTLKLLDRELALTRKLYEQKVVPEIEMLRLDRQATEMRGQLAEAQSKIANITASFRSQADEDLAKSRGDLAVLDENIKSAQDRVRRTDLKAPVHGIVNKLNVTTIGAVVQPGANVMDIIPLDDSLLVEGKIKPQDIAFIRPDQDAVVKISAYDSSVYGHLDGKVERISADTIVDDKEKTERPETFYRVMVRTEKNHLGTETNPLPIIPGMVTTVEILTGEKSVLDYLLKPARTLRSDALREH